LGSMYGERPPATISTVPDCTEKGSSPYNCAPCRKTVTWLTVDAIYFSWPSIVEAERAKANNATKRIFFISVFFYKGIQKEDYPGEPAKSLPVLINKNRENLTETLP